MLRIDHGYKRQILSRYFLFEAMAPKDLDAILAFALERRAGDGTVIFQKGDPGTSMIAVLQGRVRISSVSEAGREVVFNVIETGEVFGELALLDGKARSADATALGDCLLLIIDRRDFVPFLERNPAIAIRMLGLLCQRVRETSALVEEISFFDLSKRLSRLLLRLSKEHGRQTGNGLRIGLRLSQKEIGCLISTSRESVNKQLRLWREQGLILFEGGYITLLQRKDLEAIAGTDA